MAYVTVPKDLTKVKNKVAFNLTKRQIVCMAIAAAFGIPFFFLTRDYLGITNAATGMVLLMVPAFLFGMYEKSLRSASAGRMSADMRRRTYICRKKKRRRKAPINCQPGIKADIHGMHNVSITRLLKAESRFCPG